MGFSQSKKLSRNFPHHWSVGYESLDNELPSLARDAELGHRYADKLIKVTMINGKQDIIYIEAQGQADKYFAQRMYVYNYRIYDKFGQHPVSLAVLADNDAHWKPEHYDQERWGCRVHFTFPVVKLTDYMNQLADLLASDNPFALLTAAHFFTRRTRHNMHERLQSKLKVANLLYQKGWDKQELIEFFAVIDWLMHLPAELAKQFHQTLAEYEQEGKMRYVTSIEQIGFEHGMQQGMQQGVQQGKLSGVAEAIEKLVRVKFSDGNDADFMLKLYAADQETLNACLLRVLTANSIDEVLGVQH